MCAKKLYGTHFIRKLFKINNIYGEQTSFTVIIKYLLQIIALAENLPRNSYVNLFDVAFPPPEFTYSIHLLR